MRKKWLTFLVCAVLAVSAAMFAGCDKKGGGEETPSRDVHFTWENTEYTPILGDKTTTETFDDVIVNPVGGMRDDFLMGVDASMVDTVEACGGVYYNEDGREQDVFQIFADHGVNFFRVRIWNNPYDKFGKGYGGGDVDTEKAIAMSKRAAAAGLKILVDLHYSDVWADPESQDSPNKWVTYDEAEVVDAVKTFTSDVMTKFKDAGLTVDMIQIGNEINNGMLFDNGGKIDWSNETTIAKSFDFIANVLKAGISGAQAVNPDTYTMIHLANGGNFDEFDAFFAQLSARGVAYDVIGASYYPYYHGPMSGLADNLNRISAKYDKPVVVAEMSYGFTNESNAYTQNTYNESMEDAGGYVTGIQGQATFMRDVIEAVVNVPGDNGLGVFYWEPAWLPVKGAAWSNLEKDEQGNAVEQYSTWANQGLFSYGGKVLPSLSVFERVKGTAAATAEVSVSLRAAELEITLNKAAGEALPANVSVETNLGAIRSSGDFGKTVWADPPAEIGEYTVTGRVEDKYDVTAKVSVIENFILDPGYENRGSSDELMAPWQLASSTPAGEKVVKLESKNNYRSGKSNLNWWYAGAFSFSVKQDVKNLENGTYNLSVYIQGDATKPHDELYIYIKGYGGEELRANCVVTEWNDWHKIEITGIPVTTGVAEVGIVGSASAETWGHIDDWELVKA